VHWWWPVIFAAYSGRFIEFHGLGGRRSGPLRRARCQSLPPATSKAVVLRGHGGVHAQFSSRRRIESVSGANFQCWLDGHGDYPFDMGE